MQRKLTVILSADIVGYSSLMERDEAGTLARLQENRRSLFEPRVAAHGGRVFKLMGDGALVEFPSAVAAVTCALEIQQAMEAQSGHAEPLAYRIGINLGDVIVDGDDIYGDGVNVAARLQAIAATGGIALSRNVSDQVTGKIAVELTDLGPQAVKNIERPVHVFAVLPKGATPAAAAREAPAQRVSICVLPFANMSGEAEQEYFSDGISEDIITDLSKVSALWVAARNTSFAFKGKTVDISQLAKQLSVSHVLEGSVRKAGNRVRITAQLIEASGGHIWAERYDRDLDDIFALQDEISRAIVDVLKVKLLPEEKQAIETRGTSNAQAYKYYLLGRQFRESGNTGKRTLDAVIRLCERAVELDPNYAQAWALIGNAKERLHFQGETKYDPAEAVARALAIDDKLPEARALNARLLGNAARYEEAERDVAIALALDADHPTVLYARASLHFLQGRMREAAPFYERLSEISETDTPALGMLCTVYSALHEIENARHAARRCVERTEKILAREPDNCTVMSWLVGALGILGEHDRAREWIDRALILEPADFNMRYNFACTYVREMGDHDTALDLVESTLQTAPLSAVNWIKADPDMNPLRENPRFMAMLAKAEARLAAAA